MASTPPSPPWYTVAPPFVFGVIGAGSVVLLWLLKDRTDGRKTYVERHSGDDEDEAVKENVKRIKKKQDIEFLQREQGLLVRSWDLAQEESYPVAIVVFVFSFIWWLLYKQVFCSLLWLFIRMPLVCYELTCADIDENIIKPLEAQWRRTTRRRQKRTDDDITRRDDITGRDDSYTQAPQIGPVLVPPGPDLPDFQAPRQHN
jgi:hypothetical protein